MLRLTATFAFGQVLLVSVAMAASPVAEPSLLFGNAGELWKQPSRLPDFSFSGYQRGEKPLPRLPQAVSVKDFGAKGDGIADDTKAFKDALAALEAGAVFVPKGRYLISDFLYIRKSNVVLRGAGPDSTVLWFPKGLEAIKPLPGSTSTGTPTTRYSFDFAFLTLEGQFRTKVLATVTAVAKRGDSALQVSSVSGITKGQSVMIRVQEDGAQSLKKYLYSGDPGDISSGKSLDTKLTARVVSVEGNRIRLDRALRFETRPEWKPEVMSLDPTVSGSGIEDLGLEFPDVPYAGHFKELGSNGFEFRQVTDCWVRNVRIHNADMGVLFASDAFFNTATGIVITADAGRGALHGHHAFQFKHSQDNLVENFDIRAKFVHDLSVEHASGNVYAGGKGTDLCFDHHKDTPYENLYVNLHCGLGTRAWNSGGGASIGRNAAAWSTFWNIRADRKFDPPPAGYGPVSMNIIGIHTDAASVKNLQGAWMEAVPPAQLQPQDLRARQLELRLGGTGIGDIASRGKRNTQWVGPVLEWRSGGVYIRYPEQDAIPAAIWHDLRGRVFP